MKQTKLNIDPEQSKKYLVMQKHVLRSISDCRDQGLFETELKKSERWLLRDDLMTLVDWVLDTFGTVFHDLEHRVRQLFEYLFGSNVVQVENS